MKNALKLIIGIVAVALIVGISGVPAMASPRFGIMGIDSGMMGNGMMSAGMMQGMMSGKFDMNAMHRAMHGEDADADMNAMHKRMLAGNLTEEDWEEMREEMKEHCPMMR